MVEFLSFREGEVGQEPAVTVESFTGQSNSTAVRIEAGEDARELLPHLDRLSLVEVNFPAFGDGRGYSAARILREAGYSGELRAVGDVLVDQIVAMRRCGFSVVKKNDWPLPRPLPRGHGSGSRLGLGGGSTVTRSSHSVGTSSS